MTETALQTGNFTAHDRAISAMYGREASRWTALRARLGQKAYSTWGFWSDETRDMNEACDAMVRAVTSAAQIAPGQRVLDVGCGGGASTLDLARLSEAREVVGIDITSELLAGARDDARRAGAVGVRFEHMSATRLSFPEHSFERVVAIDCASHFDTREDFFREAARVLQPGGRITLLDLVLGQVPKRLVDRALLWLLIAGWRLPKANCHDSRGYQQRLENAGFRPVTVEDVTARILPGATAHMLGPTYQTAFRAEFGRARAALWRVVLAAIARAQRAGLVKFILITAERP